MILIESGSASEIISATVGSAGLSVVALIELMRSWSLGWLIAGPQLATAKKASKTAVLEDKGNWDD